MRIEVFPGAEWIDGTLHTDYYYRTVAGNGQTLNVSEGYTRRASAHRAAKKFVLSLVAQVTRQDWDSLGAVGGPGSRFEIVDVES
jgi:hypothetical protein